jgi:hypothetical protein
MTPNDNREFLWKVIGRYDAYLGAINTKAAGVVAVNAFVIGIVVLRWADLMAPWSNQSASVQNLVSLGNFLVIIAILFGAVVSTYHAAGSVTPRADSPTDLVNKYKSHIFYGDVADFSHTTYHDSIKNQGDEDVVRDCAYQAHALARILNDKFATLKKATSHQMKYVVIPSGVLVALWVAGVVQKLAGQIHQ